MEIYTLSISFTERCRALLQRYRALRFMLAKVYVRNMRCRAFLRRYRALLQRDVRVFCKDTLIDAHRAARRARESYSSHVAKTCANCGTDLLVLAKVCVSRRCVVTSPSKSPIFRDSYEWFVAHVVCVCVSRRCVLTSLSKCPIFLQRSPTSLRERTLYISTQKPYTSYFVLAKVCVRNMMCRVFLWMYIELFCAGVQGSFAEI